MLAEILFDLRDRRGVGYSVFQGFLRVHVTEPMHTHQVESGKQLAVSRVSGVVGVQKAIFINHGSRAAG